MDIFTLAQLNKLKKNGGVGYSKTETIFPLAEISFDDEGYCIFEKAPFVLTAGNKYTVTYNGVEYNRIASDITILEETFCFVGNLCFVEGEAPDTGEPFLIVYMGGMMSIMSADSTATISVVGEVVHKIDPKYLPGVCLPVVELETVIENGAVLTAEESAIMTAAMEHRLPVILRFQYLDNAVSAVAMLSDFVGVGGFAVFIGAEALQFYNESGQWVVLLGQAG